MRVAIVGIGGVGGYYGGRLAHRFPPGSEHEILFLCRGAHLEVIRHSGLRLITRSGELVARPALATDDPAALGKVDVAVFTVKGYDLPQSALSMRPAVRADTIVIPLGNGVDNDDILREGLKTGIILNGGVYISTHVEVPGTVEQTGGSCKLFFGLAGGDIEPFRPVENMFRAAGIDATLIGDVRPDVWGKYIFIGPMSGVTSVYGLTLGQVLGDAEKRSMLAGLMREVESVARAQGVRLADGIVDEALGKASSFPPDTKSSMQLDVERGRKTEVETMLGYVVRKGAELGIATPLHDRAYAELTARAG
jgi:2-dehydropantoate 2-reductase